MNNQLFRKVSLEKLSSPDQLDQAMHVASPMYWTALVAILAALTGAGIWSYTGNIPTKSVGEGTIIRPGGVFNISSAGAGYVKTFDVRVGDHVKPNQVVAEIYQPASDDDIAAAEQHLAELRRQAADSVALREDSAKLQVKSLDLQSDNAKHEIEEQKKMEKIVSDEVATNQQLYEKGLITRQPVVDSQQRLVAIQSAIGRLRAEITQDDSQAFQTSWQPGELRKQRQLEIRDQEAALQSMRNRLRLISTVVAPVSGEVVEEKIYAGTLITAGAPVISIQPDNGQVIAVLYVPSTLAKDVHPGMDAEISPSTAKREEYGFIRGKVTFVAHYPATTGGMMTLFENDSLVASLRGRGMVTEVDVAMEPAHDTPSGFRWSSSHGPETQITPGTLCSAQIITRTQKPITLVFPFLKKLMGVN
jgi:HlyD family secretion protein